MLVVQIPTHGGKRLQGPGRGVEDGVLTLTLAAERVEIVDVAGISFADVQLKDESVVELEIMEGNHAAQTGPPGERGADAGRGGIGLATDLTQDHGELEVARFA